MYTGEGTETLDPEQSRRFFISEPTIMVTVNEEDQEIVVSLSEEIELKDIHSVSNQMKKLANEYLLNYTIRKFNKSIQPRDFAYQAKVEKEKAMDTIQESISRMFGSKLTSYQNVSEVKIHIKHSKPIDEETRGSRSRNIKSIFLERAGEKFRFPGNHLMSARAMARHMSYGGNFSDQVGSYIIESAQNYVKLKEFLNYTKRNNLINENTSDTVDTIIESLNSLKSNLSRLAGSNSYRVIAERITTDSNEVLSEDADSITELKDQFTVKRFDEKFLEILPCVNKIIKEKKSYLSKIEESSTGKILLKKTQFALESSMITFDNKHRELGFKISQLAESMVDNDSLADYVKKISTKISEQKDLNSFEVSVLSNIFENASHEEDEDETEKEPNAETKELKESVLFETKINTMLKMFL
jgi:hypothetical protein